MLPSKQIVLKIRDEVHVKVSGLTAQHLDILIMKFRSQAPNYFFNPKFKLGVWDGYINFFFKTGETYVELLPEIIPRIVRWGYKIKLIDTRSSDIVTPEVIDNTYFDTIINEKTSKPWELRYYQVEGINALLQNAGGILIAGTGSGKTACNAVLVDSYGKKGLKTITIVPSQDLIVQTRKVFTQFRLDNGEYSGKIKDLEPTHIVSTWQALQHNPNIIKEFQVVIVDECHGLKGIILRKILSEHGQNIQYRFGLTGTLPKAETDAMMVRVSLGNVVYEIPAHKLIEEKYLANIDIQIIQLEEDFRSQYEEYLQHTSLLKPLTYLQFKKAYFPEWIHEKQYLQVNKYRLQWIANLIKQKRDSKHGNILCLVNGIAPGKKLHKLIPSSHFLSGSDKQDVRQDAYELFKDNDDIIVIATVHIASTGLDIERVNYVMMIDIGKSFIRTIQTIGRGLRKAHDKENVTIFDIGSDLKYSKRHLTERITYYREAKYPHKKQIIKYEE